MKSFPDTRSSLLNRVCDSTDHAAWNEFVTIYHPVILRLAFHKGMQLADAEDVAQQVLMSVAEAVELYDRRRAKFRTWLHRIAQNAILNALSRRKPDQGSGDSVLNAIIQQYASNDADSNLLHLERRREIFRWAAREIRKEFHRDTWRAFWLTAVEDLPIEDVAKQLGKNKGSVYASRSRVMKRLQDKVLDYESEL